jgi:DNA-binding MarR family transcriptional regulator
MAPDPVDDIAASLARLRGPRPRPPWEGPGEHGPGPRGRGGPWGHGDTHHAPPWADHGHGHGRFGGPARLRLLDALAAASAPLTVSEIAEAVGVDQPRASRLVQQAVAQTLVRREVDPDDARRTRVALTDTGAAIVARFRGERRDAVRAALAGFSDAERTELARLLGKLVSAWPGG